nr:oligoendopeptidase F [Helcococcus sueciensis]
MKRNEVALNQTWDIAHIYKTEEDYNNALEKFKELVDNFVNDYQGKLDDKNLLDKSLEDFISIYEILSKINSYATLPTNVDAFDEEYSEREFQFYSLVSEYLSKLSFYTSELILLDENLLKEAKSNKNAEVFIDEVLEQKAHALHPEVEKAFASLSATLRFPYTLYNETKAKDIDFPDFKADGKDNKLSYNIFEGEIEYEKNTEIRRKGFRAFSDEIAKYQNTTASAYNAQVQKEKTISTLRGFESVIDYLLSGQKVSRDLYNRQIDLIMEELAPHLRKYANIIKSIYKLDKMTYADLKVEIDPSYSNKISFDEAQKYVLDGLNILGEDYLEIMKEAFNNRWIDYANNEGKSTGAFCASPYGTPSYICMTFNGIMSDVMTLAHELGHAGHFQLTHENQSVLNSEPSMYFVEAPSTTNELLVENYLLEIAEKKNDKRMKRWVLSQMISKTYYHNFVTHLLEAHYQREVYKIIDEGGQVNAKILSKLFKETLEKFWGDSVELTKGAELTWMRQPHYYMGLYPYTYSAGLTIGTQVSRMIKQNGEEAASKWIEVLKMGGTKSPEELAKAAGVDVSTDNPLKETIAYIGSLIDEIEEISKEMGEI